MSNRSSGAVSGTVSDSPHDKPVDMTSARPAAGAGTLSQPVGAAGSTFDATVRGALSDGRIAAARSIVADAEAVLAAHDRGSPAEVRDPTVSRAELSSAKARIALATGDVVAAHAILVLAIEADPDAMPLRTVMAEMMLATGRATDIRPVLQHLGRAPAPEADPVTDRAKVSDTQG